MENRPSTAQADVFAGANAQENGSACPAWNDSLSAYPSKGRSGLAVRLGTLAVWSFWVCTYKPRTKLKRLPEGESRQARTQAGFGPSPSGSDLGTELRPTAETCTEHRL